MAESVIDMVQHLIYENQHGADLEDVVDVPECPVVFEVPAHLRATSPASFHNKGLQLGLHQRTLTKSQTEVLKFDIARIVHSKLATRNSSWTWFAQSVVGDVNKARRVYSTSSAKFTDEEIQHLLALDALFLVVLFKYFNGRELFFREFAALDGRFKEIATIDKTDFFLVENQVPMYLLHSAIRQLLEIDEETAAKRAADPGFRISELKVEDELEKVLNAAVLDLNPFTYPEMNTSPYCWSRQTSQSSRDRLHQHMISTYPVEPLEKSLINCTSILDCLYTVICGHSLPFRVEQGVEANGALETIPSATRLRTVGIRVLGAVPTLREVKVSGTGYLRSATLQLPKVALYDYSESAFHNLALHEQQVSAGQCGDLRCYLQCMASLCVDVSDYQTLSEEGVINNHMGNDTLSGM